MPITIQNSAGGGVTLDSTTTSNETVNLPTGGGTLITTSGGTMTGALVINSPNQATGGSALKIRQGNATTFGIDMGLSQTDGHLNISRVNSGTSTHMMTLARDSGNVGIGTASPDNPLHISKEIAGYQAYFNNDNGSAQGLKVRVKANDSGNFNILDLVSASTGSDVSVMTVRDDGNVGIGTSSPATPLDVTKAGGGNFVANFQNTTAATPYGVQIKDAASGASDYPLFQVTNSAGSTAHLKVMSGTGQVQIGSPASSTSCVLNLKAPSAQSTVRLQSNDGYDAIDFKNSAGSQNGYIRSNTSSVAYNTSSDYRLKTDVQPMTGAADRVKLLKPCNFEWIVDGTRVDGFIAHEAQEVVPESVTGTKDAMMDEEYEVTPAVLDDEGNETTAAVMGTRSVPDMQGIDQSKVGSTINRNDTRIDCSY